MTHLDAGRRRWLSAAGALAASVGMIGPSRTAAAATQRPVALVIGNARYGVAANGLRNPVRDAQLVGDALHERGFEVTRLTDLTTAQMNDALATFGKQSRNRDLALVYFAGHAVAVDGVNYLFGVDVPVAMSELTVSLTQQNGLSTQRIKVALNRANVRARLSVIDACRTAITRGAVAAGLVRTVPAGGELIAYSTQPGATANDGFGDGGPRHSPYAFYFAEGLRTASPQATVETFFKQVTADVQVATANVQVPHYESNLVGTVRFGALEDARTVAMPTGTAATIARGARPGIGRDLIRTRLADWEYEIERGAQRMDAPRLAALRARAKVGDVVAITTLGLIEESGSHGKVDHARAAAWYRQAADREFTPARTYLGELTAMGRGVTKDFGAAERLFQSAADAGHNRAALNLMDLRMRMGAPQDPAAAGRTMVEAIRTMNEQMMRNNVFAVPGR